MRLDPFGELPVKHVLAVVSNLNGDNPTTKYYAGYTRTEAGVTNGLAFSENRADAYEFESKQHADNFSVGEASRLGGAISRQV